MILEFNEGEIVIINPHIEVNSGDIFPVFHQGLKLCKSIGSLVGKIVRKEKVY
jgi:phage repressor protein C with HTH and peptisase S24 domain